MKAFQFRLGQVLRWREQEVLLEEARVAAVAVRLASIRKARTELERATELAERDSKQSAGGIVLQSYSGFLRASRRQAQDLDAQETTARAEYAAAMARQVEANRKARLLQNLRDSDRRLWQAESDKELADFAAEAFLIRHSAIRRSAARLTESAARAGAMADERTLKLSLPNGTIEKRTGA